MCAFTMALLLAAAPLLWFDLDPNAGEKMLRWSGNKSQSYPSLNS